MSWDRAGDNGDGGGTGAGGELPVCGGLGALRLGGKRDHRGGGVGGTGLPTGGPGAGARRAVPRWGPCALGTGPGGTLLRRRGGQPRGVLGWRRRAAGSPGGVLERRRERGGGRHVGPGGGGGLRPPGAGGEQGPQPQPRPGERRGGGRGRLGARWVPGYAFGRGGGGRGGGLGGPGGCIGAWGGGGTWAQGALREVPAGGGLPRRLSEGPGYRGGGPLGRRGGPRRGGGGGSSPLGRSSPRRGRDPGAGKRPRCSAWG